MNSKMIIGQYYSADSWIHRLDPRTKLGALIILMVSIFLIQNIYVLLGMFAFVLIIIFTSKVPFGRFLQSLRMILVLLLFTFVFQVMFSKGDKILFTEEFQLNLWSGIIILVSLVLYFLSSKIIKKGRIFIFIALAIGLMYLQTVLIADTFKVNYVINIYERGLITAFKVMLRIFNLIFISSLLTLTTTPTQLNDGLEKAMKPLKYLKIPVSIFSMMISIALRFIPTLINEANKILKAQASRGVDFKEGRLKEKIVQIISLLVPMFVIVDKKSSDLANAMEARGYIPGGERTKIRELKYRFSDCMVYIGSFIILGSIIFCKIKYAI